MGGVLWVVTVAVLCGSSRGETSRAQAEVSIQSDNSSTPAGGILVQPQAAPSPVSSSREKRGTLPRQDDLLGKREGQKIRFSSWAGKRSEDFPEEDKRVKFSSWGGKRSEDDDETFNNFKRAKFSSWGGKRDYLDDSDEKYEDKRGKFNSWAGKRAPDGLGDKRSKFSSWAGKRGKFNSWAGKRSDSDTDWEGVDQDSFSEDKRAKFSSWAGKRSPDYVGNSWNKVPQTNRLKYYTNGMNARDSESVMKLWQDLMSRKRARFSSWAGKRSDESISELDNVQRLLDTQDEEKRAKFSSWAGKRDDGEKRKFSSWGGKRDGNESYGEGKEGEDGYPSTIVKRSIFSWKGPSGVAFKRKPVFSSWGGKRSGTDGEQHSIQARSVPIKRPLVFMSGVKGRPWASLSRPIRKQPEFYAWGGKRST